MRSKGQTEVQEAVDHAMAVSSGYRSSPGASWNFAEVMLMLQSRKGISGESETRASSKKRHQVNSRWLCWCGWVKKESWGPGNGERGGVRQVHCAFHNRCVPMRQHRQCSPVNPKPFSLLTYIFSFRNVTSSFLIRRWLVAVPKHSSVCLQNLLIKFMIC